MIAVQIAVAKTNKYATLESGDTAEVVERPHGGFSVVLADGQGSGKAAKNISHLVTTKAVSMIKDGIRDGAVARSVHDFLYAYRGGKVSATLVILTVDLSTRTLVMSRNSHCPILVHHPGRGALEVVDEPSNPIGIYAMTKPAITQLPLEPHTYAVTFSDGVMEAGSRESRKIDLMGVLSEYVKHEGECAARGIADHLLEQALRADSNRPADDMSVLALAILPNGPQDHTRITPSIRRMEIDIPL